MSRRHLRRVHINGIPWEWWVSKRVLVIRDPRTSKKTSLDLWKFLGFGDSESYWKILSDMIHCGLCDRVEASSGRDIDPRMYLTPGKVKDYIELNLL